MKEIKKYEGREVIFIASYGSTNYGTRTPESDHDYKVFLMPNFEDLYKGKMFNSSPKIDGDDYEFHDIRKLSNLFYKSNPAYLEILQAKEMWINPKYSNFVKWLMNNKHRIAKMNLKGHYKAITGMAVQKMNAIKKDLPNSDNNEGYKRHMKFGFDTKQLLHVIRLMEMRDAIFLRDKNPLSVIDLTTVPSRHNTGNLKDRLLDIKANKDGYNKEEAIVIAKQAIDRHENATWTNDDGEEKPFMEYLNTFEIDEDMHEKLQNEIMKLVKRGL